MKKRILVLDDSEDILEIVEEVLTYENYEVKCINNCDSFYTHISGYKPDLVVLDYRLTDGNGGEICKELKNDTQTRHIPVILFSAYTTRQKELFVYGCDEVINKPFDLEEFTMKIEKLLSENNV